MASRRWTICARRLPTRCMNSDMLDEQMREQLENMSGEQLEQLIEQLIERMEQEDYITVDQPHDPSRSSSAGGQVGDAQSQARFEITDKGLDFLGFRALARSAGIAGQIQLRTPRHARHGDRHRSQRRVQDLRVRRHAEPRHHGDAVQRDPARGPAACR